MTREQSGATELSVESSYPTSRKMYISTYILIVVIALLRMPAIRANALVSLPSDLRTKLADDSMMNLAINVGIFLAIILVPIFYAVMLVFTAAVEKRLLPAYVEISKNLRAGFLYLCVTGSIVPIQAFELIAGNTSPPRHWLIYCYLLLVLGLVTLRFRRALRAIALPRRLSVIAVASLLMILPLLG